MTSGSTQPDVIVVGGGVIGCAVAYFLAAEHRLRALIIERNGVGSEASGGAAGELAAMELAEAAPHEATLDFTRYLQEGVRLHQSMAPALLEESGIDYLLADLPMIRPAFDDQEAASLRSQLEQQKNRGLDGEWLEPEQLLAMGSWLAEDAVGAIFSREFQVESYAFSIALAQAAEQHGVEIRTGEVTGIQVSGGKVTGVKMGRNVVYAPRVVIANGPWAREAAAWVGIDLPIIPLRGQIVHLDLPADLHPPRQAIFHSTGYVLPKAGGDLMVGTTVEDVGFNKEPTIEARDGIMEAVVRLAPNVLDIPIKSISACLRPYCQDASPVIGAVPGVDGLHVATGHGFKGITLALITGKTAARAIAGQDPGFPMGSFSPARFAG